MTNITENAGTKNCPFCAEKILDAAVKCKHCGEFLDNRNDTSYGECSDCGAGLAKDSQFCPVCSVFQTPIERSRHSPSDNKDKTIAALLAICLGALGIHKFYLNRKRAGFIYLILSVTGISLFLGIIDGITLLSMQKKEFNLKYNS